MGEWAMFFDEAIAQAALTEIAQAIAENQELLILKTGKIKMK